MFIKITYSNSTRKLKTSDDASLATVKTEIVKMLGEKAKDLTLCYIDAEGEQITVSSEEDWSICIDEFKTMNKDKPVLSVSVQLVQSDEFVTVNDSKVDCSTTHHEESEIKEEQKEATPTEETTDNKVVEEVKKEEVIEEKMPEQEYADLDQYMETEIQVPAEQFSNPEDLKNYVQNLSQTLSTMFGVPVDIMEARLEQNEPQVLETNISVSSTLTTDQKTEIEDLIEEKVNKMLNMKKSSKKSAKKCSKKSTKKEFTHRNIICNGCKKGITNMARFKSLVIADYDLCEECEQTGIHAGPMVKYSTPSNYGPWQLNQKFSEFSELFKNDNHKAPQATEETTEGFRHHHHPHPRCGRFGRTGPHGDRMSERGCTRNVNPAESFLQNIGEHFKPFSGLFNVVPNIIQEISKAAQKKDEKHFTKKDEKKQEKKETKPEQKDTKPVEKETKPIEQTEAQKIAVEVQKEFPEFSLGVSILEAIITENGFTNANQVVNYLL